MKIGRYQLENLVREGIKFLFADLRTPDERALFNDALLAQAQPFTESELREKLSATPRDAAILLLCHDGTKTARLATSLELEGFKNVYIVREGIASLQPS